jgi:AcrR family transcriptional regulator
MYRSTAKRPAAARAKKSGAAASYHHGSLREALIQATDEILREQGVEGFSLREAARRAGVTPGAPAHHFGSAAGLLSEVAMMAFESLSEHLAVDEAGPPAQRMRQQGHGYVRFAVDQPGRFQLMFRKDLLSADHAGLQAAGDRALGQLESTVRALHGVAPGQPLSAAAQSDLLAAWSAVHGFAHLALAGKLSHMHKDKGATSARLLAEVLPPLLMRLWPDPPQAQKP